MDQKIEIINNWNLKKLINELESGHIKIPKFQRDYIWEKTKVVKLLNSIYHQYPIGSFFFWIAPPEYSGFIRENEELGFKKINPNGSFQFILDGQQRMISLYVSLRGKEMNGTDYGTICFNPTRKEFTIPRSKSDKSKNIPVWKLFNNQAYGEVYKDLISKSTTKNNKVAESWRECHEIFSNYPISIVKTMNEELEDVVEIFERINQAGKHLTVFDLIHATTWSESFDLKDKITDFNNPERKNKYGALSNKVFTLSLALDIFDDARTLYQLRLTPQQCQHIWPRTKTALLATLEFFKQIRITDDLSAYHNFIPIIQYYFFRSGLKELKEEHKKAIEKWFWDAKFKKRYASSIYTRMKEDAAWVVELLEDKEAV
ncbi:MAG: DUF262 domain-containing protein [Salinivirgaceae bacterium]|jgi:hypothetical protein|nr:DUF262 domain-containing protein [Salinivirgaceae bacterium]